MTNHSRSLFVGVSMRIKLPLATGCVAVAALGLILVAWRMWSVRPAAEDPSGDETLAAPRLSSRLADFVGSRACVTCHAEIAMTYFAHPMGRSLGRVDAVTQIEHGSPGPVTRDGDREYLVVEREGVTEHIERVVDDTGIIYEQAVPVHFALGSGRRGRSYLTERDGQLFQSPLGWYTQRGCWDLSPGYRDDRSLRFERVIDDSCLYCHAGRTQPAPGRVGPTGRFGDPVFSEEAIGCERCHGPGGRHVARMERIGVPDEHGTRSTNVGDTDIVNPSHLSPERRDAVCNQCHLAGAAVIPRLGRGFFDFRPGDLLDDTVVVLESNAGDHRVTVSHTEQMRASRCFTASKGSLGCTSCHDPHTVPAADDRDVFYRARCHTCHGDEACGLSLLQRVERADNSCIRCHMPKAGVGDIPHTALTNHTIIRHTSEFPHSSSERKPIVYGAEPRVFADGASRLPRHEVNRARGLWAATLALRQRDSQRAAEAVALLLGDPITEPGPAGVPDTVADDVPVLLALGDLFAATGRGNIATACYTRILALDPQDEAALAGALGLATASGQMATALDYADRLAQASPFIAEAHSRRAAILATLARWRECQEAAERAVALDPTAIDAQQRLIEACRHLGDEADANAAETRLRRLEDAIIAGKPAANPP